MSEIPLLVCPSGHDGPSIQTGNYGGAMYWVQCNCGWKSPRRETREKAIETWNRRHEPESKVDALRMVLEEMDEEIGRMQERLVEAEQRAPDPDLTSLDYRTGELEISATEIFRRVASHDDALGTLDWQLVALRDRLEALENRDDLDRGAGSTTRN